MYVIRAEKTMGGRRVVGILAKSYLPVLLKDSTRAVNATRALTSPVLPRAAAATGGAAAEARRGALYSMAAPIAVPAGDTGSVHHVHSSDAWRNKLQEVSSNPNKLAVVDFTAAWCGPCKMIAPIFTELSKRFASVLFLKVDVDEVPEVTAQWSVQAMPTFVFIAGGKEVHRVVGANKNELEAKLVELSKGS